MLSMLKMKKYILLTPVPKNRGVGGLNKREGLSDNLNINKQGVQIKVGEVVDILKNVFQSKVAIC